MNDQIGVGGASLRESLLRWTAIAGFIVGGVRAVQLVALLLRWGPRALAWGPFGLGFAMTSVYWAADALLLIGSWRLWKRSRGARPILLAYVATMACAQALYTILRVQEERGRWFRWLLESGVNQMLEMLLLPIVVLIVLCRLAPAVAKSDDAAGHGFEVIQTTANS